MRYRLCGMTRDAGKQGDWCCEWLDDLRHKHHILHDFPGFYALQATDNWTTFAINVPGYFVCIRDHGRTATLCPREVNDFRRLWADHERCTAILVSVTSDHLFIIYATCSCCDCQSPLSFVFVAFCSDKLFGSRTTSQFALHVTLFVFPVTKMGSR